MEHKNTGLDLEREIQEQTNEDWRFGGVYANELIEFFDKEKYLPIGELQQGREDFMDCVTRGYNNIIEIFFNYLYRNEKISFANRKWLEDKGYVIWIKEKPYIELSDRFTAMLSNTTRSGNSMKGPADAIRKYGCIPKKMLPANSSMTWNDYHNKSDITDVMKQLGEEWNKRFPINYEQVPKSKWLEMMKLTKNALNVAGHAWPTPVNGIYPRVEGALNHAFVNFQPQWFIFDNYPDWRVDNDWIKQLAPNFNFYIYGYRLIFHENPVYEAPADGETYNKEFKKGDWLTWWQMWFAKFKKTIGSIFK